MNLMLTHILPHSIKNPLTGILGLSDLLNQHYDTMTQTDVREIVDGIHSSAQKLHHLIQNFLFYTNLDGAIADPSQLSALMQQRVVYPSSVIGDAALHSAHRANRQADLLLDLKDVILPMAEAHLQKLVGELVDNAFQYSEPGTPVLVSGQIETLAEGLLYTLTISDRGQGMTAEQIANLTADLQHPPSPLPLNGYASTKPGLGWAIAQRLVMLYHGKLTLHSVPKQFTTVQMRFPILAIVLPAPSDADSNAANAASDVTPYASSHAPSRLPSYAS